MTHMCQLCQVEAASYDSKTNYGPWAYVCGYCYLAYCDAYPHATRIA